MKTVYDKDECDWLLNRWEKILGHSLKHNWNELKKNNWTDMINGNLSGNHNNRKKWFLQC